MQLTQADKKRAAVLITRASKELRSLVVSRIVVDEQISATRRIIARIKALNARQEKP